MGIRLRRVFDASPPLRLWFHGSSFVLESYLCPSSSPCTQLEFTVSLADPACPRLYITRFSDSTLAIYSNFSTITLTISAVSCHFFWSSMNHQSPGPTPARTQSNPQSPASVPADPFGDMRQLQSRWAALSLNNSPAASPSPPPPRRKVYKPRPKTEKKPGDMYEAIDLKGIAPALTVRFTS